jgi:hypothetical protein
MTLEKVTITFSAYTIKTRFANGRNFIEFCSGNFKNDAK